MNPKDVLKYELIGIDAEIVDAKNKSLIGIKGKIIDETKNTITIETQDTTKKILKEQVTIKMKIQNKIAIVNGEKLVARAEDRIKKRNKI